MRRIAIAVSIVTTGCLGLYAYIRFMYPFGDRPGTLTIMHGALLTYAQDHGGWFPSSKKGGLDALRHLYPQYCPTGKELAGVSGNIDEVVKALREGRGLDRFRSWVYSPGFRVDDDPCIAVLWESRGGLYSSGWRNFNGGHSVLLVRGDITNVPGAAWNTFLKSQEVLREAVLAERSVQTNSPRQTP
jgi:hypothetical protein